MRNSSRKKLEKFKIESQKDGIKLAFLFAVMVVVILIVVLSS